MHIEQTAQLRKKYQKSGYSREQQQVLARAEEVSGILREHTSEQETITIRKPNGIPGGYEEQLARRETLLQEGFTLYQALKDKGLTEEAKRLFPPPSTFYVVLTSPVLTQEQELTIKQQQLARIIHIQIKFGYLTGHSQEYPKEYVNERERLLIQTKRRLEQDIVVLKKHL